jgi:hypothetical protein
MSVTIETKVRYQHILKMRGADKSWELNDRIEKFIKSKLNCEWSVNSIDNGWVIETETELPHKHQDFLLNNIPKWIVEINKSDALEKQKNFKTADAFIRKYKFPTLVETARNYKILNDIKDLIIAYYADIKSDWLLKEGNVCSIGDLKEVTTVFNMVKRSEFSKVAEYMRHLDTSVRESLPRSLYDKIDSLR